MKWAKLDGWEQLKPVRSGQTVQRGKQEKRRPYVVRNGTVIGILRCLGNTNGVLNIKMEIPGWKGAHKARYGVCSAALCILSQ